MSEQKNQKDHELTSPVVIYENENLLVLDKPAGWVVNDATTTKDPTIQSWIESNFDFSTSKSKELRAGIVHRIDKLTSGCLLVAKTESVFFDLQKQFQERKVEKKYLALVHGIIEPEKGEINYPIGRLRGGKFGVVNDGRDAKTLYSTEKVYENNLEKFTLVELSPKTGRTHQIRVHMKALNHPLVGDKLYVGRKNYRKDIKWCPRMFLHAKSIKFTDPVSGKELIVESDLPQDLKTVLQSFSR